jgi:adenylyltransferase/sulfurtransferase
MNADRYDRQRRVDGWDQDALDQAHVFVAGAGALGNELLKNLALLGIGHLLVVDFDRIERSNLSRTVLFRDADVGRPKAQVAAQAARQLNPQVDVRYVDGDLFYDVGLGFYRHADLVIGGLDNIAARSEVGLNATLAGVPFLDGGMWALGGEVRWFLPGDGPCFECTLTDADRERAHERRSCTGFRVAADGAAHPRPTTASTAAIIGGVLAQEAARYLCSWEIHAGEAAVYNGLSLTMHRATLSRDPECPYHTPYQDVVELDRRASEVTGRDLLARAEGDLSGPAILELGRDFLLWFDCPRCGRREEVNAPLAQVDEGRKTCPHCGATRQPEIVSQLERESMHLDQPLGRLGVPPGEVLVARVAERFRFYELTADVRDLWPEGGRRERGRSND